LSFLEVRKQYHDRTNGGVQKDEEKGLMTNTNHNPMTDKPVECAACKEAGRSNSQPLDMEHAEFQYESMKKLVSILPLEASMRFSNSTSQPHRPISHPNFTSNLTCGFIRRTF